MTDCFLRLDLPNKLQSLLLDDSELLPLVIPKPNPQNLSLLEAADVEQMFPQAKSKTQRLAGAACLSALWLHNGYLNRAHEICQDLKTVEGSYWHGIMHRIEGDYWNAKYWFNQVGVHPSHLELANQLKTNHQAIDRDLEPDRDLELDRDLEPDRDLQRLIQGPHWDAALFVDVCQQANEHPNDPKQVCQKISTIEWWTLFRWCYSQTQA